ncbi:VOC family protein [Algicella marina]|uniref:VOC family protein n=1 Tax=Algicella marina TaxID=2683284 RepID=A0A6P1T246_9RHOB|nr:VOC family protein [Algicella marina]QHQ37004.1 VOC family protein [Algicella marina]
MDWKPQGYTSASPYLMVTDAERTLRFVEDVFGGRRLRVFPREGGGIMHAEAMLDDTVIMMGEAPDGPESNVHVYVPDAEAVFARAEAAGGTVVQPLQRKGDGDYRGGISDGTGCVWWISTQEDA